MALRPLISNVIGFQIQPRAILPVFHIGTLVPLVEPGASVLFEWAQEINQYAPIVFDPNVRPSVVSDRARYESIVKKWAAISNVVKVSEDDIAWLYPGRLQADVAAEWLSMGVDLVVITLGSEGLMGITRQGTVQVPGVKVTVADTVGAGDTVGAILVEGVVKYGVAGVEGETLKAVLQSRGSSCGNYLQPPRSTTSIPQ
jgi:fructokinase